MSEAEVKALNHYLYANELIMRCKEAAVRVSPQVWAGIEERMLTIREGVERVSKDVLDFSEDTSLKQQTVANGSTSRQRRLEEQQDSFQAVWDLKMKRLEALRKALAVETGVAMRFQLEQQIQDEEVELAQLNDKLELIEQALSSGQIFPVSQTLLDSLQEPQ